MLKFFGTDLVISKGYDDKPALRFSDNGGPVRFRVGKRTYDKREKDNYRWVNLNVKGFGEICERIKKMKLDAGSFVHIEGRYDEDVWEDDGKSMRAPVIILENIEYAYTGNGGNKQNGNGKDAGGSSAEAQGSTQAPQQEGSQTEMEMPTGFTGYTSFGSPNPFF